MRLYEILLLLFYHMEILKFEIVYIMYIMLEKTFKISADWNHEL